MKIRHKLAGAVFATLWAVVGFLGVGLSPASAAPAPSSADRAVGPLFIPDRCYANGGNNMQSCTGQDPDAMGCGADAVNRASGTAKNGVQIYLRYSATCRAVWTKYVNQWGAAGTAKIYGGSYVFSKTLAGYPGEQGWTRMISDTAGSDRACLQFNHEVWGQVEYCVA